MDALVKSIKGLSTSRVLRQAGWLAAAKVVQGACSIVATVFIARHLAPTFFGQLSLAIAAASVVATAAALGLEQVATRVISISTTNLRQPLRTIRRLRALGAIAGFAVLVTMAVFPALHPDGTTSLLLILSLLPLAQVGDVAEWRLLAGERGSRVAQITFVTAPAAALARLVLVVSDAGVEAFAWALVAEWALRSTLLTVLARGENDRGEISSEAAALTNAWDMLRQSIPLLMAGIAVFFYMRIDQFMIGAELGSAQVGIYSAAVVLAEAPLVIPVLILRAALPQLSREAASDPSTSDRTLVRLMRGTFYLHVIGAVIVTIVAKPVVLLVYGEAYMTASSVLTIQAWGAPFVAIGVLSGAWLVLNNFTAYALWRTLVGAGVNIALNVVLIPRFGIAGAAYATIAAFVSATLLFDSVLPATRPLLALKMRAIGFSTGSRQ